MEEGVGLPPARHRGERVLPVQNDHRWQPWGSSPGRTACRGTARLQCAEQDDSALPPGFPLDQGVRSRGGGPACQVGFMHQRRWLHAALSRPRAPRSVGCRPLAPGARSALMAGRRLRVWRRVVTLQIPGGVLHAVEHELQHRRARVALREMARRAVEVPQTRLVRATVPVAAHVRSDVPHIRPAIEVHVVAVRQETWVGHGAGHHRNARSTGEPGSIRRERHR